MSQRLAKDRLYPLFGWRSAVASNHGPASPVTRHVLLTLSLYMSEKGDSCFPSVETLVKDTGLSKPTIIKHLAIAKKEGWLSISKHGFAGQKWARNDYEAKIPEAVKKLYHLAVESGKAENGRRLTSQRKVVKEVYSNSSVNSSKRRRGSNSETGEPSQPPASKPPGFFEEESWPYVTAISFAESLTRLGTLDPAVERANGAGREKYMQDWAAEFDKLNRIDEHSPERIEQVLTWLLKADNWWIKSHNIRTAKKLRSKKKDTDEQYFNIMLAQMQGDAEKTREPDRRPPNEFADQLNEINERTAGAFT